MRDDVREKMVLGAMRLLATNGLEGVSFSTVLELTGTPRGSWHPLILAIWPTIDPTEQANLLTHVQ